ncbi:hypothetical protein G3569_07995 [Aliifodinibius halophilus]|uniref:Outer membrane beta-barrel protein n=2 Tax=Fodinibius halophilus TaxID=1736908 RepID=A0A6M1TBF8_9BACT|nr:hypothetical protein [Fodinibius halophilus]
MPKLKVQEASEHNVQAVGLRWTISDYDGLPYELGFHFFIGYGRVASGSLGLRLAYIFGEPNTTNVKLGLSFSKIDLNDVDVEKKGFGPHVGDVNFTSRGNVFKPFIEFEWDFLRFSSIFVRSGYRIINGQKSTITSVDPTTDPSSNKTEVERRDTFFFSAAGFEFGAGISLIF